MAEKRESGQFNLEITLVGDDGRVTVKFSHLSRESMTPDKLIASVFRLYDATLTNTKQDV